MGQTESFPDHGSPNINGQDQPSENRRSNPVYELFVLGELMSGSTYGYKLNEIVNRILGPYQQLSWGTLYPLIRRLEREHLITTVERQQSEFRSTERGQPRRSYAITEVGRERFFELMLHPQSYSYHPGLFAVQLTKFEFLPLEQRLDILRHYQNALRDLQNFYLKMRPLMEKKSELRESERPFVLQLIDYRIHMLDAELVWFGRAIADSGETSDHQTP
jgi:DNA-binding PadR family transcriptional regulator